MVELPRGTVTFLFTDIEGSTRLLSSCATRTARCSRTPADRAGGVRGARRPGGRHPGRRLLLRVPARADAASRPASRPARARGACLAGGTRLRVRIGHPHRRAGGRGGALHGIGVHRAARIMAAGHGGQVLLSKATATVLEDERCRDSPARPRRASAQGHRPAGAASTSSTSTASRRRIRLCAPRTATPQRAETSCGAARRRRRRARFRSSGCSRALARGRRRGSPWPRVSTRATAKALAGSGRRERGRLRDREDSHAVTRCRWEPRRPASPSAKAPSGSRTPTATASRASTRRRGTSGPDDPRRQQPERDHDGRRRGVGGQQPRRHRLADRSRRRTATSQKIDVGNRPARDRLRGRARSGSRTPATGRSRRSTPTSGRPIEDAADRGDRARVRRRDAVGERADRGTGWCASTRRAGRSSRRSRSGTAPTGIAFGGGAAWVANSLDGTVSRIDPATNSVIGDRSDRRTARRPSPPTRAASGSATSSTARVVRIDPRTNDVARSGQRRQPAAGRRDRRRRRPRQRPRSPARATAAAR